MTAENTDLIHEMLARRSKFESGEFPLDQPRMTGSPTSPEGEKLGTPAGNTPEPATLSEVAQLLQLQIRTGD